MSLIKYVANKLDSQIAIKFDSEKNKLVMGGKLKNLNLIIDAGCDYFGVDFQDIQTPQSNKVRVEQNCTVQTFLSGLHKMKESGFQLEQVTSHHNIMR